MFIGITLKIKRLDKSFLADRSPKLLSSRWFGSNSGYCWPFSEEKSPKERICSLQENTVEVGFEGKTPAERNKSAAFPCCKSQFFAIPEVPAQESSFYRAWDNRPKEGTLWS